MIRSVGRQLSLREAISVFETMPASWQLASLHPALVQVDAKRDSLLQPVYWCFEANGQRVIHSFQLGDNPSLGIKDIQSAYGYGGPLSDSDDVGFLGDVDDAFKQWAKENSVIAEFLRLHPLIPYDRWYSGDVLDNRETVWIDLTKELFDQYQTRR